MLTLPEKQLISSFLGSLYLCKPTRQVLDNWRQLPAESVPALLNEIVAEIRRFDSASDEALDELVWEYTRLFIGPYKLESPPWESVYTSPKRLMMQEAHEQVRECYREAGFELEQEGLMADHAGLELSFLSMLFRQMLEAPEQAERAAALANGFIRDHQANWVPRFADDLEGAAESPLYGALARATRNFVRLLQS